MNTELTGNFVDDCSAAKKRLYNIALDLRHLAAAFETTGNEKMTETLLSIVGRVIDVRDAVGSICENRVDKDLAEATNANAHLFKIVLDSCFEKR